MLAIRLLKNSCWQRTLQSHKNLTMKAFSFYEEIMKNPIWKSWDCLQNLLVRSVFIFQNPQNKNEIQTLLNESAGTSFERPIHYGLLRSLRKAEYSPEDAGHYALAIPHYCHFTSPIRRYPDLTVHRLIDAIIKGKKLGKKRLLPEKLEQLGEHCSKTERNAEKAERELKKIKLLAAMEKDVGEVFTAYITGIERFGIFCELTPIPVEGRVGIGELPQASSWDYYADQKQLISRSNNWQLRLGDEVKVIIKEIDQRRRIMSLALDPQSLEGLNVTGTPSKKSGKKSFSSKDHRSKKEQKNYRGKDGSRGKGKKNSSSAKSSKRKGSSSARKNQKSKAKKK